MNKINLFNAAKTAALSLYYKPKKKKRMAKEKVVDPVKVRNKLLTTAIKKTINNNSVLPILEDVYFTGKEAVATDLETAVVIPFKTEGIPVCAPAKMMIDIMEIMDIAEMKIDKNFGIEFKGAKRDIKIMGDNPSDFPIIPMFNSKEDRGGQPYTEIGRLLESDMELLEQAICFVSNDDLRPAMTGVCIEAPDVNKQSWMAATDAHRLFFRPMSEMKESFILPPKAVKILLAFGGKWAVTSNSMFEHKDGKLVLKQPTKTEKQLKEHFEIDGVKYFGSKVKEEVEYEKEYKDYYGSFENYVKAECRPIDDKNETHYEEVLVPDLDKQPEPTKVGPFNVCFKRDDGVTVITRVIDARFPDYRVVVPKDEDHVARIISDKEFLLRECKNALKFSNRSTNQVVFTLNGSVAVNSQDVDFSFEYNYEFTPGEAQAEFVKDGLVVLTDEENEAWEELRKDYHKPEWMHWKDLQKKFPRLEPYKGISFDKINIAFNAKFLMEALHKQKAEEPVVIKVWGPTKAAVINEGFLIMPLMLNQ